MPLLEAEIVKSLPEATEVEKDGLAKRQARAGVALVRPGHSRGSSGPSCNIIPTPGYAASSVNWFWHLGVDLTLIAY